MPPLRGKAVCVGLADEAMNPFTDLLKRKKARAKKRLAKFKLLGLHGARSLKGRRRKADALFSAWIRARDGHRCVVTGSERFPQCSHFHSRKFNGTRFDPDNCITLSAKVHWDWESKKATTYRDFMIKRLGEERYLSLRDKSEQGISLQDAVTAFFAWHDLEKP